MSRAQSLRRRIRVLTWVFIAGLFLSGATAIPLQSELRWLVNFTGARQLVKAPGSGAPPIWAVWLTEVQGSLEDTGLRHPFLFYGTDWLAFGHFMIALAFVGAVVDPVRNRWLFDFGMLACGLVIPYAFVFGAVRGIPWWWRCIDCSFGVFGLVPLWWCRRWVGELERVMSQAPGGVPSARPKGAATIQPRATPWE